MGPMNREAAYALLRECREALLETDMVLQRQPDATIALQRLKYRIKGLLAKLVIPADEAKHAAR